jgi:predicted CXXCH cytochrome family protein
LKRIAASRLAAAVAAGLLLASVSAAAAIANTRHNLSISGPGTVKAAVETQICIFCHAPHNNAPSSPLWNRRSPGGTYVPYASSTAAGAAGQPTGASLMCLSCHDGTIALGEVLSRSSSIPMSGGVTTMPAGAGRSGTDLSDDHPVSFSYSAAFAAARGELVAPAALTGRVRLDASGQLQCTSCHDPHDDTYGKFLVVANQASALCQTCHVKSYWSQSSHRLSNAAWNGAGPNPWPGLSGLTVAANACGNCHRSHSVGGRRWLLNAAGEEDNCYPCHNGNVAAKNVQAEFNKLSRHPVSGNTGVHDAAEPGVIQSRHVECADCHNPHATNTLGGEPPGSLAGVRGITITGTEVKPVAFEYQVCFRCHADSTGKPAPLIARQIAQTNVRLEFDPANPSHHAVAGPGRSANVPSLLPPWTTASVLRCRDCHNNDAGPGAGGIGPGGPHGSTHPPLLERRYVTTDRTTESAANYALCYKCHNRNAIINEGGPFPYHKKHIIDDRTPCSVCHDAHGISGAQGNPTNNSRLINFDVSVVTPSSGGLLRFESLGPNRGRCYLTCHGKNHNPFSY